tara:strand:- start:1645 stop:2154 length:510 start_codon:yes stop_codon:yes gene_type:complete
MGAPNQQEAQGTWERGTVTVQQTRRQILTGAQTLTVAQSGALCLFNAATGYTFTLPAVSANDVGTWFEFLVTVTNTATADKIISDAATTYLKGEVHTFVDATTPSAAAGPKGFSFDGTTHIACIMGGADTTKGGVAGSRVRLEAISTTQWMITGNIVGAGTIVTPASTT